MQHTTAEINKVKANEEAASSLIEVIIIIMAFVVRHVVKSQEIYNIRVEIAPTCHVKIMTVATEKNGFATRTFVKVAVLLNKVKEVRVKGVVRLSYDNIAALAISFRNGLAREISISRPNIRISRDLVHVLTGMAKEAC